MHDIAKIQSALNRHGYRLVVDGISGEKTQAAIMKFQKMNGLLVDGIVGPVTAAILFSEPETFHDVRRLLKNVKIRCDKHGKGADVTYLREDAAQSFQKVARELHDAGAMVTSSGGRRLLSASVGANRSQTSLHYLGIAHDLFVWSGLVDPTKDPYVIESDGNRRWQVWARCKEGHGDNITLDGYTYEHKIVKVAGWFKNVTECFASHGWKGIRARKSFFSGKNNKLGAEWWHFQCEDEEVIALGSRFGDELLKSYRKNKLQTYSVWNHRNRRWKEDWF